MEATKTRASIINKFLKKKNLKPQHLARYLEIEHNFACFKDTHYDD